MIAFKAKLAIQSVCNIYYTSTDFLLMESAQATATTCLWRPMGRKAQHCDKLLTHRKSNLYVEVDYKHSHTVHQNCCFASQASKASLIQSCLHCSTAFSAEHCMHTCCQTVHRTPWTLHKTWGIETYRNFLKKHARQANRQSIVAAS